MAGVVRRPSDLVQMVVITQPGRTLAEVVPTRLQILVGAEEEARLVPLPLGLEATVAAGSA